MPDLEHDSAPELLPCPFCGGDATKYHRDEGHGWSNTDWVCCNAEDCGCQTCLHETEAEAIAAWNRRTTLRSQSPEPSPPEVRVRKLEWEDADKGMCTKWRAAALGGHYELVSFDKEPGFAVNFSWGRPLSYWFIQGEPDEWGPTGPKMFPSLDEAKAAAQADCEQRILSTLSPTVSQPGTGEEVEVFWFNPWNDYHGFQQVADEYAGTEGTVPLVLLSDYQALKAERDKYLQAANDYMIEAGSEGLARERAEARLSAVEGALTPSAETKAAYIGEFAFPLEYTDDNGDSATTSVTVPWTTVKEIMGAIRERAGREALSKAKEADGDQPS